MSLSITDIEDKEQFDSVHSARMTVKGKRVEVEKRRKELKADALAYGKTVDTEAKRITGKLEPIENHLDAEERKVTDEQKRIKEEKEAIQKNIFDHRMLTLSQLNCNLPFMEVATMTDDEYNSKLKIAEDAFIADIERQKAEKASRKAESERLERVRKEQEAEAARLAEVQRQADEANRKEREKIEADRRAIEAEKKTLEDAKRKEQERKDRAEAAENARIEATKKARIEMLEAVDFVYPLNDLGTMPDRQWAKMYTEHKTVYDTKKNAEFIAKLEAERKEKAERDASEAKRYEEQLASEKARAEALKPDREKLTALAQFLQEGINYPKVSDKIAAAILKAACIQIYDVGEEILQQIEKEL